VKLYSEDIRPLPEEKLGGSSSGLKVAKNSNTENASDDDDDYYKEPKDNYNRKVSPLSFRPRLVCNLYITLYFKNQKYL
jgi:hypothetical protein